MDNKDFEKAIEAYIESQKEIYHTPIDLGINKFKKLVRERFNNKKLQNRLIKSFKKRAWMEYKSIARHRGNFPTHPAYGSNIKVKAEESTAEVKVSYA